MAFGPLPYSRSRRVERADRNPGRPRARSNRRYRRQQSPSAGSCRVSGRGRSPRRGCRRALHTRGLAGVGDWLRRAWQFFVNQSSSSLTRRIVVLNVAGLLALSIGINYLSPFRARLIDARIQSLLQQGQIIAHAIADQATAETGSSITIDPDKLQKLQPGESYGPSEDALYGIDFPINPERVAPVLRDLVSPTKTRARIYDRDGVLLVDSRDLFGRGDVLRFDLPSPSAKQAGIVRTAFHRGAYLARPGRSAALPRARPRRRQGLSGGRAGARRPGRQHGAHQQSRRRDRFGRRAGAALPRGARRAHAVDARRRHRQHGDGRAARHSQSLSHRRRRDGRALDPAGRNDRRAGAAARRRRRKRAPAHPVARRNSRISPAGTTRSATCRARCAT